MDKNFVDTLLQRHRDFNNHKNTEQVSKWVHQVYELLFPTSSNHTLATSQELSKRIENQKEILNSILNHHPELNSNQTKSISDQFYQNIHLIFGQLEADLQAKFGPSGAKMSGAQIKSAYPEFINLFTYRLDHWFYARGYKHVSECISRSMENKHRIHIHPGCKIESGFVIHNGHDIEIGEHAQIGRNVKIYDGVRIAASFHQNKGRTRVENDVTIYSGATVFGDKTIIGEASVIGNQVVISQSVLPNKKILSTPSFLISPKNIADLNSIQSLIGNTPLVEVKNIFSHPHVKIFAKLQGQNPGGSVKDRPAFNMIKEALKRGEIKPGMKLIEPTSGNTGIALAMIACMFNLDIQLVMPENSTAQRVQTMEAYGAKVILTKGGIEDSRDYAEAQVAKGGYKMLNQFANTDNYMAHYHSTGPEIWRDTKGEVTHFVSSMGTTGTIMGTSMYLKEKSKDIQIVGVQPTEGAKIPGIRRWTPEYLPKIFNKDRVDEIIDVSEEESLNMMRRMAKQQAIFAGMSSGGAMAAAVRLAQRLDKGIIVTIVCDRGDRYLSSGIFETPKKP